MAQSIETENNPDLSRWLVVLGWVGMMIFAFHACTHMVAAGDTWVAMACGRHFVNHGVATVEPFSANSHKAGPTEQEVKTWPKWAQWITEKVGLETVRYWHPTGWINQNWLTHVVFYWLSHLSPFADADSHCYNTLVYWKFTVYIISVICVYYTARFLGAHYILSAVFACFAMFVGRTFFDIRPAGFSNLLVAGYLLILVLATYRSILYIWLLIPVIVFWCNVHGGYIYAFIMLVPFVGLHFLISLPRRWTISVYSIFMWLALYFMTYQFLGHQYLQRPDILGDKILILILILAAVSIVLTFAGRLKPELFYTCHIAALVMVFIVLFARFLPRIPPNLAVMTREQLRHFLVMSQLMFAVKTLALVVLGLVVTFWKDKLVCIGFKGICHTVAAGLTAFAAMVLFNPFHLTNLTHTFIISVSKHAERWRDVHEWHPAFEWENPVGTAFPFLIMLVGAICSFLLWFFSRRLFIARENSSKALSASRKYRNDVLSRIFALAAAILISYVVFISCSLLNLSAVDFLLCAAFIAILFLSIYKNIHFIYLVVPLVLLAVYSAGDQAGYLGRYFYPFVLIPVFVAMSILGSLFSTDVKPRPLNILFVVLTAAVCLILMFVLINPFKSGSLFDTINFFGLTRIWRPRYELNGAVPLNYKYLFPVVYTLNLIAAAVWFYFDRLQDMFGMPDRHSQKISQQQYQPPKVDLAVIIMVFLTVYMAIRSRRFIPIAAFAACPVIAVLLDQIVRMFCAARNYYKKRGYCCSKMSLRLQVFLAGLGLVAVLTFGTWWGNKFYRIYLKPWPKDAKLNSIFMRMTASDLKPFYACEFIRLNKLKGKMFNYWTEGGFIAYGQDPDPNTGETPLQLFMDGRAQAAYDRAAYDVWGNIMLGGPVGVRLKEMARLRGRKLTRDDYIKIGDWVSGELRKHGVWVVLMPWAQSTIEFINYIYYHPDWRLVFLNRKQRLFVDVTDRRGKEILDGIAIGETLYPDDYSKKIILIRNLIFYGISEEAGRRALKYAAEAYKQQPSSMVTILVIQILDRYPSLKPQVYQFWQGCFDDFVENCDIYRRQPGYFNRLAITAVATEKLRTRAKQRKETELVTLYSDIIEDCERQKDEILKTRIKW